ncbi:MAG TPA: inosine/xanthosine triphosphatase [Candidatus Eisenbacteria bacterium]|jgi:inosine/xanthosine triphosphatase|nr:inosine/xanthosine triphosphatase [Candidatus Eisenbacteria bacterium]
MRIHVGSTNAVKVGAVLEVSAEYPCIAGAEIVGIEAASGVSDQPTSLDETIRGAINRAKACFDGSDLSFGIESGIVPVPHTKTGHMDVTACVIYDGHEHHLGLSSLFECPKDVTELILSGECDMQTAFHRCGYTANPKLGSAEGAIGILTKGRVTRKDYTVQALRMALIHLEHHQLTPA